MTEHDVDGSDRHAHGHDHDHDAVADDGAGGPEAERHGAHTHDRVPHSHAPHGHGKRPGFLARLFGATG